MERSNSAGYVILSLIALESASTSQPTVEVYTQTSTGSISKLSPSGATLWKKSFQINGDSPNGYYGYSVLTAIAETRDGYILAGGNTLVDAYYALGTVMKLDKNGNLLWKKSVSAKEGANTIMFTSVVAYPDGTFTASGWHEPTASGFDWRPVVVKFSAAGQVLWSKVFYDAGSYTSNVTAPASDGGLFLGVYLGPGKDALVKLDANGKLLWAKGYDRTIAADLISIQATSDNGLLLLAISGTVLKLSESGRSQWVAKFRQNNGSSQTLTLFDAVSETPDRSGPPTSGNVASLDRVAPAT